MMTTMERVNKLIEAAKKSPTKGNYTVYNSYKQELALMHLSSSEYESAVQQLAKVLKV